MTLKPKKVPPEIDRNTACKNSPLDCINQPIQIDTPFKRACIPMSM